MSEAIASPSEDQGFEELSRSRISDPDSFLIRGRTSSEDRPLTLTLLATFHEGNLIIFTGGAGDDSISTVDPSSTGC